MHGLSGWKPVTNNRPRRNPRKNHRKESNNENGRRSPVRLAQMFEMPFIAFGFTKIMSGRISNSEQDIFIKLVIWRILDPFAVFLVEWGNQDFFG